MSQENVEVVRGIYDAWKRGEGDVALEALETTVEWDLTQHAWPGKDKYYGHEGVVEVLSEWVGVFEEYQLEAEEFIDAGERVVVIQHERGVGTESGVPIDRRTASIYKMRAGKVARIDHYRDVAKALEAAGLSE